MRRVAAAAFVVLFLAVPVVAQPAPQAGWTGYVAPPLIPGTDDLDWMVHMPRAWTLTAADAGRTYNALGTPDNLSWPEVAYRVHGAFAGIEAALTVPSTRTTAGADALYNTGVRFHAITFEPALRLSDGSTLARIFPGPLAWSNLTQYDDEGERLEHRVETEAAVTRPGPNGTAPWNASAAPIGIALRLTAGFRPEAQHHDAFALRSPATARVGIALSIDDAALAQPDDLLSTNLTYTFHYDFGGSARAWTHGPNGEVDATGIYLNRSRVYATLRFANATSDNGTAATTFSFDAPKDLPVPRAEPRSLLSPVSLNLTTRFPPPPPAPTDPAAGAPYPGRVMTIEGELGFLAPSALTPPAPPGPTHDTTDPERRDDPAPAPALAVLLLVAVAATLRKHKTPK